MTKVVVIGGGLLGMLSARELALAGCQVTIYERGRVGQESSWAGGGILSPLYPWRYAAPITELARWSQGRYRDFAEGLHAETGIDPEWTKSGLLMPGLEPAERTTAARWAERYGYRLETLQPDALASLSPELAAVTGEALWMPEVAQLRNPRFVRALRQSLMDMGVTILEETPVTAIETVQGKVSGIGTHEGLVTAESVVVCGGAWSGSLLKQLGYELAIKPVRGQMLLYRAEPGLLSQIVLSEGYYLIPRRDGRILVGSTLEDVGFDKSTTEEARDKLRREAERILPALKTRELERQWAGLRPGTKEGIPYIGAVPGFGGLFVNAGQYRNGVVTGLASARLVRNLMLGEETILPPRPYRL